MSYAEKATRFHESGCNCCQAVIMSCCEQYQLTEQQAYELGANFGSGMRCGSACGALTGALMVLGMAGQDAKKATDLLAQMKKNHNAVDCAVLLKNSHDQGIPKKEHCDGLVFEMVETLSEILK